MKEGNQESNKPIDQKAKAVKPQDRAHWTQRREGVNSGGDLIFKLGILYPPVDPIRVAREMGISVYQQKNLKHPAELRVDENMNAEITLYKGTKWSEKNHRMLVAHCLGHLMLHDPVDVHYEREDKSGYTDGELFTEAEADQFADDFLMPTTIFLHAVAKEGYDLWNVSQNFGVPLERVRRKYEAHMHGTGRRGVRGDSTGNSVNINVNIPGFFDWLFGR